MLIDLVPRPVVTWIGKAQFRYPIVRRLVTRHAGRWTAREGVIASGVGEGLRFNGTGGYPGYLLGTSEPVEQEALARYVRAGSVVYDIGANIGFYAILAARLTGPSGRVFAFEPFPESAHRTATNAELNRFEHVSVITAAVGSTTRRVHLEIHESATHRVGDADGGGATLEVDQIAIDEWRVNYDAPGADVVLIDVEGTEIEVLQGMLSMLRESRPVVMCEVHWLGAEFLRFADEQLGPLGYSVRGLGGPVTNEFVRWHAILAPHGH